MQAVVAPDHHVASAVSASHVRTRRLADEFNRFFGEVRYRLFFGWDCKSTDVVRTEDERVDGHYVLIKRNFFEFSFVNYST